MQALNYAPNRKNLLVLFIVSFLVRAITFQLYVQYNERYKQPDTMDYHNCAVSLASGACMHRADTLTPIFWRTPGYPLFLSYFYKQFEIKSPKFSPNRPAQIACLWTQIVLSSFLPLLIFALIYMLSGVLAIAWLTAWICALHFGIVLSSMYLLTEALALLFFIPFLIFFYKSFSIWGEDEKKRAGSWVANTFLAALCLGLMAWIRPMGEFVSIVSVLLIAFLGSSPWKTKLKKIGVFLLVFFMVTGGWYLRNYRLTGQLFFCPMFGPYLNSFCAPKIVRDTYNIPLARCIKTLYSMAKQEAVKDEIKARQRGKVACKHRSALRIALPIIKKHPFLFIQNWIKEAFKTTFDLYASQLVGFAKNTFMYDPLEEFLTVKWSECIYKQRMPLPMRFLVFLEIIFELLKWIGLLLGAWLFLLKPILNRFNVSDYIKKNGLLWLKTTPMIGALIFMTGGFGYARLRLPVEPLMIMLSLTFWYWALNKNKTDNS